MKRGLASPCVASALATTRRLRLQVVRVIHMKLLKLRSGLPVRRLFVIARSSSVSISATSRSLRASPNTKSTLLASHQVMMSSRANAGDEARHLLERAIRCVPVGPPQPGDQQMATAEHVQGQIAVAIVIAV